MKMLGVVIFVICVVTVANAAFYGQNHVHKRYTYDSNGFHNGHIMHHPHGRFGPPPPFGGPPPMPFPHHHHHHHHHHPHRNHYNHDGPHRHCGSGEQFRTDSHYPNSMPIIPFIPSSPKFPPIDPYSIPFNKFPSHLDPTFPHHSFPHPNQPNYGYDPTNTVNYPVYNPFDLAFNQFFKNQFGGGFPNTQPNPNGGTDSTNNVNTPSNWPVNTTPENFNTVTPLDANTLFNNQNGVQSSTEPNVEFISTDGNQQNGNAATTVRSVETGPIDTKPNNGNDYFGSEGNASNNGININIPTAVPTVDQSTTTESSAEGKFAGLDYDIDPRFGSDSDNKPNQKP